MYSGPFSTLVRKTFPSAPENAASLLMPGLLATAIALTGCSNKKTVAVVPVATPVAAPTVFIEVSPASVQAGQSAVITWKAENATDISIDGVGTVQASGSVNVTPTESTTYRITARGPGGTQQAEARVTVPSTVTAGEPAEEAEKWLVDPQSARLDVFFDTDDFAIRSDQYVTIQNDAAFLKKHPDVRVVVEGHCDEKGSTEYNLALGDRRATEVKSALQKAGVNAGRMRSISYGKEQPFCADDSEECSRLNRRVHLAPDVER